MKLVLIGQVHPGTNSIVSILSHQAKKATLKRTIQQLAVLPKVNIDHRSSYGESFIRVFRLALTRDIKNGIHSKLKRKKVKL